MRTKALLIVFLVFFTVVCALNLDHSVNNVDEPLFSDLSMDGTEEDNRLIPDKREACSDNKEGCSQWKSKGYCSGGKYQKWVQKNCAKSCGRCRDTRPKCLDIRPTQHCRNWKKKGYCSKVWQKWMHKYCRKTCEACGSTKPRPTRPPTPKPSLKKKCNPNHKDLNSCPYYKTRGFCKSTHRYFSYMKSKCPVACGFCSKPKQKVTKGVQIVKVRQTECLEAHNTKRAKHQASPLIWDRELAKQAQKWALRLATIKKMEHAKGDDLKNQGENLAMSWSSNSGSYTCKEATQAWYDEVKDYNYRRPGFSSRTGHFTQVVWRGSKRLGVGIARNGNWVYVVARYSPPGNVRGRFEKNVKRGR